MNNTVLDNLKTLNSLRVEMYMDAMVKCKLASDGFAEYDAAAKDAVQKYLYAENLTQMIEKFNKYFSDVGWFVYDSMDLEVIVNAVSAYEMHGLPDAEQILIQHYINGSNIFLPQLYRVTQFKDRRQQVESAIDAHIKSDFGKSIHLMFAIMDGVVNDFTGNKGFFAKNVDLSAFDYIVGCENGLSKIKQLFSSFRGQTNNDKIYVPFRNGIVHGRDVNYANIFVSSKCLAALVAISDWICYKDKADYRMSNYKLREPLY